MSFKEAVVEAYRKFYSRFSDFQLVRVPRTSHQLAVKYSKKLHKKGVKSSGEMLCAIVLSQEKFYKEVAQTLVDERVVLHEYHVERLMARRKEKKLAHYKTLLKANLLSKEAYDVLEKSLGD